MKQLNLSIIFLATLMTINELAAQTPSDKSNLVGWQVDSMQKVFQDDLRPDKATGMITIDAARNEVVSGQVVVWCAEEMTKLNCRANPLALTQPKAAIAAPQIRYMAYVPVRGKSPGYTMRPRPCNYPDPLHDEAPGMVRAQTAQPIWLTLKIPADAAPGLYKGSVEVEAMVKGAVAKTSVPLSVQVYAADLPDKRTLKVSNWAWFDNRTVTQWCGVDELYKEPFWKLMEEVAKNMAAHRQNVIFTPTTAWTWGKDDPALAQDLITGKVGQNGGLDFDFTHFDRWVTLFRQAGVDALIEAHPLARRSRLEKEYMSVVWKIEAGKAVRRRVASLSPEYEKYLSVYLPALEAHLEKQGWLDRYVQHVLDEPNNERKPTYVQVAQWFRKYAPRLRTIDATQTTDLVGSIDIWAPLLPALARNLDFYKDRQVNGNESWFYTCLVPAGPDSLNRFVEYPLTRVRLLHWANHASGTTGYLHWAYNWWVQAKDPSAGTWRLQPGDEWLVYPKKGGVNDSIRYEAMLEGIQDYELLKVLSVRDPKTANAICDKLVTFSNRTTRGYQFDDKIDALRDARRELLQALSSKGKGN